MRNIHIDNSYNTWLPRTMDRMIDDKYYELTGDPIRGRAPAYLNRPLRSLHIEWWLHNIGYYVTLPFCHNEKIKSINLRCKHVDLEEWKA